MIIEPEPTNIAYPSILKKDIEISTLEIPIVTITIPVITSIKKIPIFDCFNVEKNCNEMGRVIIMSSIP